MKNFKIRTKILIGLGCLMFSVALMTSYCLRNLRNTSELIPSLYEGPYINSLSSVAVLQEIYRMENSIRGMVMDQDVSTYKDTFQKAMAAANEDIEAMNSMDSTNLDTLKQSLNRLNELLQIVTDSISNPEETQKAALEIGNAVTQAEEAARKLASEANKNAEIFLSDAESHTNHVIMIANILCVICVIFAVITAFKMANDIGKPIYALMGGVKEVANGNLNIHIPDQNKDELGLLSGELNHTMENIKSYVSDISQVLEEVGKGNISVGVTREYIGDFHEIKDSLNKIVVSLNHTMRQIRDCADRVHIGASSLASNSQALAQGASEQNSALDSFQVSVGRVAELSAQDAATASKVRAISDQAWDASQESDRQMSRMMEAMNEINASSQEIAKVIKIIEDIAFQTNILALNANVEAARAGQAGKGFAVVADEVRNLANKSSEAAKHTTEMINNAIASVNGGMVIVDSTASALRKVGEDVKNMAGLLGEIDRSTQEQARAIQEMNESIGQITTVVHANSATAEENSTSSDELSAQAGILEGLIVNFKLKDENPQTVPLS